MWQLGEGSGLSETVTCAPSFNFSLFRRLEPLDVVVAIMILIVRGKE